MVGPGRLELPTPRLSSVCSNQLSYGPILVERTADVLLQKKAGVVRYPKNRERETWTAQLVIL